MQEHYSTSSFIRQQYSLSGHTQDLHVTEINLRRWICGVSRSDRIRNTFIRGSLEVHVITDEPQGCHLRWFDHVTRLSSCHVYRLWARFSFDEIKYLIFSFVKSGNRYKCLIGDVSILMENECLNTRYPGSLWSSCYVRDTA